MACTSDVAHVQHTCYQRREELKLSETLTHTVALSWEASPRSTR